MNTLLYRALAALVASLLARVTCGLGLLRHRKPRVDSLTRLMTEYVSRP